MTRVRVTIDRLVLPGLDPADRKALLDAFQTELRQVLADPTTRADWARPHRTPVLRLGRVPLAPGFTSSRAFGGELARGLGRGLKP